MSTILYLLLVVAMAALPAGVLLHVAMHQTYKARLADFPTIPPTRAIDPKDIDRHTVPLIGVVQDITRRNPEARDMVAELRATGDIASRRSDEGRSPRRV